MPKSFHRNIGLLIMVTSYSAAWGIGLSDAIAQVVPDQTLPTPSQVIQNGPVHNIHGGSQAGSNLFHSFSSFSVPTNQTAAFQNAATIQNIFTRVTGRSVSQIDGTIQTQGTANLFLLNPNGILFGANAQLQLGGSFLGSTADAVIFRDGKQFNAINPQRTALLTMSSPIGLQFGATPAPIQVNGPGNQTFVEFPFIRDQFRPDGLQVDAGKTLALVGGEISLKGGNLTARDGRIIVKSLGRPSNVAIVPDSLGFKFIASPNNSFGDIDLTQAASIVTSGNGSGSIHLQGQNISLVEGATLQARTMGNGTGTGITVQASEQLSLSGFSEDSFGPALPSSILTDVAVGGTGTGGNIQIMSPIFQVSEGSLVSSGTFDQGAAGSLNVTADVVDLFGVGPFGSSGLFTDTFGPGAGGNLNLNTQQLFIRNGAQVSASTLAGNPMGSGPAGKITVKASVIELLGGAPGVGSSGIFSNTDTNKRGGKISLNTDTILITGGAQVATFAIGLGSSGDIEVNANQINLIGTAPNGVPSGLFTTVVPGASGSAGQIEIQPLNGSLTLNLESGAQISSATSGNGNSGVIDITAHKIVLDGKDTPTDGITSILAAVESGASGQGGSLNLNAQILEVNNGAQITAGTRGAGTSGDLNINAQTITLQGGDSLGRSGLFVNALENNGDSGNLNIVASDLKLLEGATINASNFPSQETGIPAGSGAAGNVNIIAQNIIALDQLSSITVSTAMGDRGNIILSSPTIILRNQSNIAANAFGPSTGGNITLNTEFLIASQNSDITANAEASFGGQVTVNATGLFGIEFRNQLTPFSDITASSALGPNFSGIVDINTPEVDPSKGLSTLPDVVIDPSQQVQSACRPTQKNSFIVRGRGGQPDQSQKPLKAEMFDSDQDLTEVQPLPKSNAGFLLNQQAISHPSQLEAKSWQRNENGYLQLLSWAGQDESYLLGKESSGCVEPSSAKRK